MEIELIRSTRDEKEDQISNLSNYQKINSHETEISLHRLKQTAINKGNCFEELMETTKSASSRTDIELVVWSWRRISPKHVVQTLEKFNETGCY